MDFIEKWKFKMQGRGIRALNVEEVNDDGQILVLRDKGKLKRNANTLQETWDGKGAEITPKSRPIQFITSEGITEPAFVTFKGQTVNILRTSDDNPPKCDEHTVKIFLDLKNLEEVIGRLTMLDIIAELLETGKGIKTLVFGAFIGGPAWWVIFQLFNAILR